MRSFFSHIIFAVLAVVAVGGYFHWEDILSRTGQTVCAYDVLGRYGSSTPIALGNQRGEPGNTVPASANNAATGEKKTVAEAAPSGKNDNKTELSPATVKGDDNSSAVLEEPVKIALAAARRAFWKGDSGAEYLYLELIRKHPQQADIRGELGNVYYKSGRQQLAAEQYFEAGMTMLKSGKRQKAQNMLQLLRGINPGKAEKLRVALAEKQ